MVDTYGTSASFKWNAVETEYDESDFKLTQVLWFHDNTKNNWDQQTYHSNKVISNNLTMDTRQGNDPRELIQDSVEGIMGK